MAVSKRLRYEILRRDNHTCRYCGAAAPDVHLTVDHVLPVALGGSDDATNLVAACRDCNAGKTSSTPDSPLVADVSDKAILWARAMQMAMEQRQKTAEYKEGLWYAFEDYWTTSYNVSCELGDDWRSTVYKFNLAGLSYAEIEEAVDIAYQAKIPARSVWKYFCGVCWRKIDELNKHAQYLIESGEVSADD